MQNGSYSTAQSHKEKTTAEDTNVNELFLTLTERRNKLFVGSFSKAFQRRSFHNSFTETNHWVGDFNVYNKKHT